MLFIKSSVSILIYTFAQNEFLDMFFIKSDLIEVRESPGKGKGIFAKKNIAPGTIVECSPVLVLSSKDTKALESTFLYHYYFIWGDRGRKTAIALGYCSLYNHDYHSNCIYETDYEDGTFKVITRFGIKKNDELFINYNFYPDEESKVWFDKSKTIK